jgi:phenylpyruvate tautomerase PptA (4-oxalocrotonate tautomerase family)
MPTYVCSIRPGLLDDNQKTDVAKAITRNHHEATGAPPYFVQVVIDEKPTAQRYVGGEPAAADQVWIRADIRSGRTLEQRSGLMLAIMRDVARIAGIDETLIWVYLCNLEPTDMVEYGQVLPPPGREQEWFDALPSALQNALKEKGG